MIRPSVAALLLAMVTPAMAHADPVAQPDAIVVPPAAGQSDAMIEARKIEEAKAHEEARRHEAQLQEQKRARMVEIQRNRTEAIMQKRADDRRAELEANHRRTALRKIVSDAVVRSARDFPSRRRSINSRCIISFTVPLSGPFQNVHVESDAMPDALRGAIYRRLEKASYQNTDDKPMRVVVPVNFR